MDKELTGEKEYILPQVFTKPNKFPVHWSSKMFVRYKHNAIIGELYGAKRMTCNFDKQVWRIREKYWNASFPSNFVNKTIHNFKKETEETTILNGFLNKENYLLWDFHTHLQTRNSANYWSIK